MTTLRYGDGSIVQLDSADEIVPDSLNVPRGEPLTDLDAAMTTALHAPIDFLPLAQCATPGDRVVLALDDDVHQAAVVVAAVVRELIEAHVEPDGITILQTQIGRGAGDPRRLIDSAIRHRITLTIHNPDDRRELAYLAADASGEAILVNRALHEADVVLPIGCLRGERSAGYFGIHGSLYPTFSDAKTQHRFRGLGSLNSHGERQRELVAAADNVAWLLGVLCTVQLVPGAGNEVLHVVAGLSDAVRRRGQELYRAAWACPVERQANLVVATIEGDAGRQTWDNFGRALHAAGCFVEEGGAIALCCDLDVPPGPAMRHLIAAESRESALRHIGKERPADALPAAVLARTLDRNKVYLLSRLDTATVEELDMVPIGCSHELVRLVEQHPSRIVLSNAPYVTIVEEQAE